MIKRRKIRFYLYLGVVFLSALLVSPSGLVQRNADLIQPARAGFFDSDLEMLEEIVDLVAERYVYPPDYKKMFHSGIQGMIDKIDDPDNFSVEKNLFGETLTKGKHKVTYRISFNRSENMEAFKAVYNFLSRHYTDKITKEELEVAGTRGLMNSLDPYSLYMDKEEFERSMRDTEGQYGGCGMVISQKKESLTIIRVMKNSPAQRVGLLPDDIIIKVNGVSTKGLEIQELARKLRGYPNTKVAITIARPGAEEEKSVTMTREIISIDTVNYKIFPDRTAYIRITSFSKQTNDQLEEALQKAKDEKVRGFILDLRENPGGLLNQSVKVASHFLKAGKLIVYTRGRMQEDHDEYHSIYRDNFDNYPLVILINKYSASASEIVAGSLKDSGKALIIGENSYGKGSVQTIYKISDGSGLRLTTSKYFTPSGIDITQQGIVPEIIVQNDLAEKEEENALPKKFDPRRLPPRSSVTLKMSELEVFIKDKGLTPDKEIDSLILFARIILKDSTFASKSHALAKARELVKELHY